MQVREVADEHAAHLGRLDDLVATKADHAATQTSFAAVQARREKEKREAAAALAEVAAAAERQSAAEEQLASHASQILDLQVEIQTKATLDGLAELAERIGLCALREEAREQIENLRHESASRIRMLKERLDHTDRELLRQLEESHSLDNIERVEALTALIESKADKDVAERWVESSEALHMELQARRAHAGDRPGPQGGVGLGRRRRRPRHRPAGRVAADGAQGAPCVGGAGARVVDRRPRRVDGVDEEGAPRRDGACTAAADGALRRRADPTPSAADRPRTSGGFMNAGAAAGGAAALTAPPRRVARRAAGRRAAGRLKPTKTPPRTSGAATARPSTAASLSAIANDERRRRRRAPRPSAAASTSTRAAARLSSSGCRAREASACRPPCRRRPSAMAAATHRGPRRAAAGAAAPPRAHGGGVGAHFTPGHIPASVARDLPVTLPRGCRAATQPTTNARKTHVPRRRLRHHRGGARVLLLVAAASEAAVGARRRGAAERIKRATASLRRGGLRRARCSASTAGRCSRCCRRTSSRTATI